MSFRRKLKRGRYQSSNNKNRTLSAKLFAINLRLSVSNLEKLEFIYVLTEATEMSALKLEIIVNISI